MQNLLKQSAARGFASFERRFARSILQLTLFYSLIIGVILLITASITYSAFSTRIGLRFNRFQPPAAVVPVLVSVSSSTDGTTTFITALKTGEQISSQRDNQKIGAPDASAPGSAKPSLSDDDAAGQPSGNGQERRWPTAAEVRDDLVTSLILVNTYLFLLAIGVSYLLARLTLRPLKHAYNEQRRFIADASHELRTPLAVMKIELENQLGMGEENGKASLSQEEIQSHLEEVDRMSKIVQDLLLLSKLEGEPVSRKALSEINLSAAARDAVKRLQPLAKKHGVTLSLADESSDSQGDISVKGNEQISHVLINIMQNAIIYNEQGGSVSVTLSSERSQAAVTVKDTGIGMSKDDLAHAFDRFYRADKSRSRSTGGSGLGLSIVERGIKSIGGSIVIESEIGKGTTVQIFLKKA